MGRAEWLVVWIGWSVRGPRYVGDLNRLATIRYHMGRHVDALPPLHRAREICERDLGEEHLMLLLG